MLDSHGWLEIIWQWSNSVVFQWKSWEVDKFSDNQSKLAQEAKNLWEASRIFYSFYPDGLRIWEYTFFLPKLIEDDSWNKIKPKLTISKAEGLSYLSLFYLDFYKDRLDPLLLWTDKDVLDTLKRNSLDSVPYYVMEEDPMWKILYRRMESFWKNIRRSDGIETFIEILQEIGINPSDLNPGNFMKDNQQKVIIFIDFGC